MESDFPRGGKVVKSLKRKCETNLFSVSNSQAKKKKNRNKIREKSEEDITNDEWQLSLNLQGTLTYNTIKDGMTILASIKSINNMAIEIELPGLVYGRILLNSISDQFNEFVENAIEKNGNINTYLNKLFKIGQFLPTKILSVENSNDDKGRLKIMASINPTDINSNRRHNSFTKGLVIWGTIKSEQDHGYEISVGVKNCTVFLPNKNIEANKKYVLGEHLYCVVHKLTKTVTATTLTVSAKKEHLNKTEIKELNNLDNLIPGMKVEFLIEKIEKSGIKGRIFDDYFGYLDESQLFSNKKLQQYKEGTTLKGTVLYIELITNVVYISLRSIDQICEPKLENGEILSTKVISICPKGLYVEFENKEKGYITNRRLLNTLQKPVSSNLKLAVQAKYPLGGEHKCRILNYSHMGQLYICTFENKLIKERLFSTKDLQLGEIMKIKIDKIVPKGLLVKSGHINGFVPNIHTCNGIYSDNLKQKYQIGMQVDARILNITNNKQVIFTLKKSLIDTELPLITNIDNIQLNTQTTGYVGDIKTAGVLINFYGDLTGWLSNRTFNAGNEQYCDPKQYFFQGQVVDVWIVGTKNNQLSLSLNCPLDDNEEKKVRKKKKQKNKNKKLKNDEEEVKNTKEEDSEIEEIKIESEVEEIKNRQSDGKEIKLKEEMIESDEEMEKIESDEEVDEIESKKETIKNAITTNLPGINSFYKNFYVETKNESSSDEELEDQSETKRKKKLTSKEKAELFKKEEERISRIEKELAESTDQPQSVEQFDRLLLANPNSSELWLKYMALHISTAELDKARAAGKRALETINMTQVNEKFNVWIALLNLENLYGTKESFESLFQDAVRYNDSLEVYLSVIKLLASSGKCTEMEEKIKKIKSKDKFNPRMWLEIGQVYYKLGNLKEARNIKQSALRSITDKKTQFNLIVQFAVMEFQQGELEQAVANFETILDTYPTKINIWIIYVDQLIKKKEIENARQVLERAVSQKLPIRSMKSMFHKFLTFEEQYGSPDRVEIVKNQIKEYVDHKSNNKLK